MKLVYYDMSTAFGLKANDVNSIVIESPDRFEKFIIELHASVEEREDYFALYDDTDDKSELHKTGDIIISPFDLSFDKREVQKKLYGELDETMFNEGLQEEFAFIQGEILEMLDKIRGASDYDIEFEDDFDSTALFRLYDMHIANPKGRFDEKLIEYIITMRKLTGKNFFAVANCESFLNPDSYRHLAKCAGYYGICIVFLSNRQIELLKDKNTYIIDMDLCEIH